MCGSVAEWSKALDLGSSLYGGVGSNPTTAKIIYLLTVSYVGAYWAIQHVPYFWNLIKCNVGLRLVCTGVNDLSIRPNLHTKQKSDPQRLKDLFLGSLCQSRVAQRKRAGPITQR